VIEVRRYEPIWRHIAGRLNLLGELDFTGVSGAHVPTI